MTTPENLLHDAFVEVLKSNPDFMGIDEFDAADIWANAKDAVED